MDIALLKTLFSLGHIFGAVIGAGGALYSDVVFFKSLNDGKINRIEFSFLKTMSVFVWIGLALLIVSGAGLFALDPERYAASGKFIMKMLVVLVIFINGLLFHLIHMPFIKKRMRLRQALLAGDVHKESARLVLSGVVSIVSWASALLLGSLRSIALPLSTMLSLYLLCLCIGAIGSLAVMRRFLNKDARTAILVAVGALLAAAFLSFVI